MVEEERKLVTIALGGNAILHPGQDGTAEDQRENVRSAMEPVSEIIREGKYRTLLTHGNGPQAGALLIQQEDSYRVPRQDMDIVVAMSQGQIGYIIEQELENLLREKGLNLPVVSVINQVLVDPDDPEFHGNNASKPVGPFYTEEEAKRIREEKGYLVKKVIPNGAKNWRRVVPSPEPIDNIEGEAILNLVEDGVVVVTSGGGGIPVVKNEKGCLSGVPAVIDKDKAGQKLAELTGSSIYLILTDVEKVKLNYGQPNEESLDEITSSEARQYIEDGHFLPGSMKPKVQAAVRFVESGGELSVITSLDKATQALLEGAGTAIKP